jgi:hypothetical protein
VPSLRSTVVAPLLGSIVMITITATVMAVMIICYCLIIWEGSVVRELFQTM